MSNRLVVVAWLAAHQPGPQPQWDHNAITTDGRRKTRIDDMGRYEELVDTLAKLHSEVDPGQRQVLCNITVGDNFGFYGLQCEAFGRDR